MISLERPIQQRDGLTLYIQGGEVKLYSCGACGWWNGVGEACKRCGAQAPEVKRGTNPVSDV